MSAKTYSITVEGERSSGRFVARSAGKARAMAWREYQAGRDCSFRRFLEISSCRIIGNRPPVGDRITVAGISATHCGWHGQYVAFMRDDSDTILLSHPSDVTTLPHTAPTPAP